MTERPVQRKCRSEADSEDQPLRVSPCADSESLNSSPAVTGRRRRGRDRVRVQEEPDRTEYNRFLAPPAAPGVMFQGEAATAPASPSPGGLMKTLVRKVSARVSSGRKQGKSGTQKQH